MRLIYMYYNPITKETKSHYDLCNYLNASIPLDTEEVEQVITEEAEAEATPIIHTWYLLSEQSYPQALEYNQKAVLGDIELLDGKYTQVYKIVELTEAELEEKRKTLEADKLAAAKSERAQAVSKIKVEVDGLIFDGDEEAQDRMSRVASIADATELDTELPWVLADNTVATVTVAQIKEALRKALYAQAALWVVPYTGDETQTQP